MKLTLEYTGDRKSSRLAELMEKSNPKYHARMGRGVECSKMEKEKIKSDCYPFTTMIVEDE